MANPWFRLYAEFATDPKVQIMSEVMQRRLIMLFCLRCSNDLVTLHETEIAFHLRISNEELAETKALFLSKGFIDEAWNIPHWEKRQFVSDSSAARVAKHREKKRNEAKRPRNVTVTPPDTDTDTDTEVHTSLRSVCESAHESQPVPDDFTPDRTLKLKAGELGLDVTLEAERFVAHHQAQGTTRNDLAAWNAQFRKWLLDQAQYNADRSRVTDARVKAAASQPQPINRDASRASAARAIGLGGARHERTVDGECERI